MKSKKESLAEKYVLHRIQTTYYLRKFKMRQVFEDSNRNDIITMCMANDE